MIVRCLAQLPFHGAVSDGFVFDFAAFANGNLCGLSVDTALLAIEIGTRKRRQRSCDSRWIESRIVDPGMIDGGQRVDHRFTNCGDFTQREITFVELAVANNRVNNLENNGADIVRVRMGQRASCCLARIGEHHDRCFLRLRLRTRITEFFRVYHFARLSLGLGFAQEEMKRPSAVMLGNEITNLFWQTEFLSEFRSVSDMADYDFRALQWAQVVVWIVALLVFNKMVRRCQLADIVIKRADTSQQGASANRSTRFFGELAYGM